MNTTDTHAVFDTTKRERATSWMSFADATALFQMRYSKLRDRFVVRSNADPRYSDWPNPAESPRAYVKLSRDERERLLDKGRAEHDLEGAKDVMLDELLSMSCFEHLPVEDVSDYAWAAARFCFPREYEQSWR